MFFLLKQISKCDTCFYMHFLSDFQKYSLKFCHKNVRGCFRTFFTDQTFFCPVPYPLNYYLFKVTTFHGVKNENAWTKKNYRGAPGLRISFDQNKIRLRTHVAK